MPFKRAHWPQLDEREYRISQGPRLGCCGSSWDGTEAPPSLKGASAGKSIPGFSRRARCVLPRRGGVTIDPDRRSWPRVRLRPISGASTPRPRVPRPVSPGVLPEALLALVTRELPAFPSGAVRHVAHHLAHAASAYYTSDGTECLSSVIDGMVRRTASACTARDRWAARLLFQTAPDSIANPPRPRCTWASTSTPMSTRSWGSPLRGRERFRRFFEGRWSCHRRRHAIPRLRMNRTHAEREAISPRGRT